MNTQWERREIGNLSVCEAAAFSSIPGIAQGFTTRHGGVSDGPYDSFNVGAHVGDDLERVQENRRRLWRALDFSEPWVAMADQVHGDAVAVVTSGGSVPAPGADALVTASPGALLMLFFADCMPVYLLDPTKNVAGLAHAGWRGTAADIASKTLRTMEREWGCRPEDCIAAVGPGIAGESYLVGSDTANAFRGFPDAVLPSRESPGKFHLDLRRILFAQLLAAGIRPNAISLSLDDTLRSACDFFSYRRDGVTGRMAAYLGVRPSPP